VAVVWTSRVENLLDSQGRPAPRADVWLLFHDDGRVTWQEATEETVSKGGSSGSTTPGRSGKRGRIPAEVKLAKDAYTAAKPRRTTADIEGTFAGERNEDGSPGLPVFKPAGRPPIIPPKPKPRPKPKPETKPPDEIPPGPAGNPDDLRPPPAVEPRPKPKRGR